MDRGLKVSHLKLNKNHCILDYNNNFSQLFKLEPYYDEIINKPIKYVEPLRDELPAKIFSLLNKMQIGNKESLILLKNNRINNASDDNAMLLLYMLIEKQANSYSIRIVNWLNWVHNMRESLNHSYSFVSGLDKEMLKSSFTHISDISCFKALYPLITHVPDKFSNSISQAVLFDIMHLFVKQRNARKCTKDYTRNVYSRLRTSLKQEFDVKHVDIAAFIKDDSILALTYNDDIQIPNTTIAKNMVQVINHDPLLLLVINAIEPN